MVRSGDYEQLLKVTLRSQKLFLFRFMQKVLPPDANGCRLFRNAGTHYGKILFEDVIAAAHVLAAQAFYGPAPVGMQVLHTCDVRACVTPEHLYYGTQSDNMLDRLRRARHIVPGGEKKLTVADVIAIRQSTLPVATIACVHEVSEAMIYMIKQGVAWGWIQDKAVAEVH